MKNIPLKCTFCGLNFQEIKTDLDIDIDLVIFFYNLRFTISLVNFASEIGSNYDVIHIHII